MNRDQDSTVQCKPISVQHDEAFDDNHRPVPVAPFDWMDLFRRLNECEQPEPDLLCKASDTLRLVLLWLTAPQARIGINSQSTRAMGIKVAILTWYLNPSILRNEPSLRCLAKRLNRSPQAIRAHLASLDRLISLPASCAFHHWKKTPKSCGKESL